MPNSERTYALAIRSRVFRRLRPAAPHSGDRVVRAGRRPPAVEIRPLV